jgi:hypothetical protein
MAQVAHLKNGKILNASTVTGVKHLINKGLKNKLCFN